MINICLLQLSGRLLTALHLAWWGLRNIYQSLAALLIISIICLFPGLDTGLLMPVPAWAATSFMRQKLGRRRSSREWARCTHCLGDVHNILTCHAAHNQRMDMIFQESQVQSKHDASAKRPNCAFTTRAQSDVLHEGCACKIADTSVLDIC